MPPHPTTQTTQPPKHPNAPVGPTSTTSKRTQRKRNENGTSNEFREVLLDGSLFGRWISQVGCLGSWKEISASVADVWGGDLMGLVIG